MATREVLLALRAVDETQGALSSAAGGFQRLSQQLGNIGRSLTARITLPLVGVGAAAVSVASDFQAQMNIMGVAAGNAGAGMDQLSEAAIRVGADTDLVGISASGAAGAMTNFFKAGLDTSQVLGDLQGYLSGTASLGGALRASIDLAAASELDLLQASDLVITSMNTFGLTTDEVVDRIGNYVQAADASVASVGDLAEAMVNVGTTAAAFGWTLEETNTALAILSSRGIAGAEAGTALKSMMTNLMRPTKDVTSTLSDLNVELFDQAGNMRPLPKILADLEEGLSGVTEEQRLQAIQTLAGSFGMKAMNALLGEGSEGWEQMTRNIANAASMQESASARTKGFAAAVEQLRGSVEAFMIKAGTPLIQNVLTPLVQRITDFIGKLAEADPKLIGLGLAIAGAAAVVGPLLIGLGAVTAAIGVLLSPLGLVLAAVGALAAAWITDFGGIRSTVIGWWSAIQPILEGVIAVIRTRLPEVIGALAAYWQQIWPMLSGVIGDFFSRVTTGLQLIIGWLQSGGLQGVIERLRSFWEQVWPTLSNVLNSFVTTVTTGVQSITDWFGSGGLQGVIERLRVFWEQMWPILSAVLSGFATRVAAVAQTVMNWLGSGGLQRVVEQLQSYWNQVWPILSAVVSDFFSRVSTGVTLVTGWLGSGGLQGTVEGLRSVWEQVWPVISGVFESAVAPVIAGASDISSWLGSGGLQQVVSQLGSVWVQVVDRAREIWGQLVAFFAPTIERLREGFDQAIASIAPLGPQFGELGAATGQLLEALAPLVALVGAALVAAFNLFLEIVAAVMPHAGEIIGGFVSAATAVIQGLATVIGGVVSLITAIIHGDWEAAWEAAKTIVSGMVSGITGAVEGLVTAIIGLVTGLVEGVVNWFENLKEQIVGGSIVPDMIDAIIDYFSELPGEIASILADLVEGAVEQLVALYEEFTATLSNIAAAVSSFASELFNAGAAMMQGMVSGVASKAGALVDAARGVVQGAIDAAKRLLGMTSPSRVFIAIGEDTMIGLKKGIENETAAIVRAISKALGDVEVEAVEKAEEIVKAARSIMDAMIAILDAYAVLAEATVPEGITGAIDVIVEQIDYVISRFVPMVEQFESEAVQAAGEFADAASSVLDIFAVGIDAIVALADYSFQVVGPSAELLVQQILGLTRKVARIAQELGPELIGQAARAGELLGQALSPWAAAVDTVAAIADHTDAVIGPAAERLIQQVLGLTRKVGRIAQELGPELIAAAALAGEQLAQALAPWKVAIETVKAIAEHSDAEIGPIAERLVLQIKGLVRKIARVANELGPDLLAMAAESAAYIVAALSPWQAAIEAVQAIAEHTAKPIAKIAELLVSQMITLIRAVAHAATLISEDALAAASEFARAARGILVAFAEGVSAIASLDMNDNPLAAVSDAVLRMIKIILKRLKQLAEMSFRLGRDWIEALIKGIESRLPDLEALMTYIMTLFSGAAKRKPGGPIDGPVGPVLPPIPINGPVGPVIPPRGTGDIVRPRPSPQVVLYNYGTITVVPRDGESEAETWRRLFGQVRGGAV